MRLSILVHVYRNNKVLKKFYQEMSKQKVQDFEIVLILDTNNENNLEIVDLFQEFFQERFSFVYNSRRFGEVEALNDALKKARGEYVLIVDINDVFSRNLTKELLSLIQKNKTDIIEFRVDMKSVFHLKGEMRNLQKGSISIQNNLHLLAYTYPFDFNKLYRRQILLKNDLENPIKFVNSRLTFNFLLNAWINGETYANTNQKLIRLKVNNLKEVIPFRIAKQWEEILHYVSNNKNLIVYKDALNYLSFYCLVVFLPAFITKINNSKLEIKFEKYLSQQLTTYYQSQFKINPYFLDNNNETKIFNGVKKIKDYLKLFKELG